MWLIGTVAVLCTVSRAVSAAWECPEISLRPAAECSCDLPYTIRCAGDQSALQIIGHHLLKKKTRNKNATVTLLDLSLRNVTALSKASISALRGLELQGLVISSGFIRKIQQNAFGSVASTVVALGLPNNQLPSVPTQALSDLKNLYRLDLSNNKIAALADDTFVGLGNLVYLDLSDNQIATIGPEAFTPLDKLAILRLRGNILTVAAIFPLTKSKNLIGLDVSGNVLKGPLGPTTFPNFIRLTTLQIADNSFDSIKLGCLAGSPHIVHLDIHNNQIDVLEDYAFGHLKNLSYLDLSQNEIVAVSGSSLAQLDLLKHLDLSHNYLRSLSVELLSHLGSLTELLLQDNDISIVEEGALAQHKDLVRFTVQDNPLNCDCMMAGFARWLREAEKLPQQDKEFAVCATPPHLEGALLYRLSKSKLCDNVDDPPHVPKEIKPPKKENIYEKYDDLEIIGSASYYDDLAYSIGLGDSKIDTYDYSSNEGGGGGGSMEAFNKDVGKLASDKQASDKLASDKQASNNQAPDKQTSSKQKLSNTKVQLVDAWYENGNVHLKWTLVPPSNLTHKCVGVTMSRADKPAEHVACNNAEPADVILKGIEIDPNDNYVFCVAIEESNPKNVPLNLILGCKDTTLNQRSTVDNTYGQIINKAGFEMHTTMSTVESTTIDNEWSTENIEYKTRPVPFLNTIPDLYPNETKSTISDYNRKLNLTFNGESDDEKMTTKLTTKTPAVSLYDTIPDLNFSKKTAAVLIDRKKLNITVNDKTSNLPFDYKTTRLETDKPFVPFTYTIPGVLVDYTESTSSYHLKKPNTTLNSAANNEKLQAEILQASPYFIKSGFHIDHTKPVVSLDKYTDVSLRYKVPNVYLDNRHPSAFVSPKRLDAYLDNKKFSGPSRVTKKTPAKWMPANVQNIFRISDVRSNQTTDGMLTILVSVRIVPQRPSLLLVSSLPSPSRFINCYVIIAIKTKGYLVAQRDTPCQETLQVTMDGFLRGPYEICAKISTNKAYKTNPICIIPQLVDPTMKSGIKGLNVVLICAVLTAMGGIIVLALFVRRVIVKTKIFKPNDHYIYYRQATMAEEPKTYAILPAAQH